MLPIDLVKFQLDKACTQYTNPDFQRCFSSSLMEQSFHDFLWPNVMLMWTIETHGCMRRKYVRGKKNPLRMVMVIVCIQNAQLWMWRDKVVGKLSKPASWIDNDPPAIGDAIGLDPQTGSVPTKPALIGTSCRSWPTRTIECDPHRKLHLVRLTCSWRIALKRNSHPLYTIYFSKSQWSESIFMETNPSYLY